MAAELVALMSVLGHETFALVGHDRGARVAYRLALDHPGRVSRLGLVNILPTATQFARMGTGASLGFWPWYFLAQAAPFPESLIEANPEAMLNHIYATWPSNPESIGSDHRRAYLDAMTAGAIAAICADYRASFHVDQQHDADDRQRGRRISAPTLLVVGEDEEQLSDAEEIWDDWVEDLTFRRAPGGHFTPEEAPNELAQLLRDFLTDRDAFS